MFHGVSTTGYKGEYTNITRKARILFLHVELKEKFFWGIVHYKNHSLLSLLLLTGVCISMALWSLICRTIVRGYTGWLASIRHMAVSIVIRTPVRPMPALQNYFSVKNKKYTVFRLQETLFQSLD